MRNHLFLFAFLSLAVLFKSTAQQEMALHRQIEDWMRLRGSHYDSVMQLLKLVAVQDSLVKQNRQGSVHYAIGELHMQKGQYDSAKKQYLQSLALLEPQNDPFYLGRVYVALGYITSYQSKNDQSLKYYLQAERIFREMDDQQMLGRVYNRVGQVFWNDNNHEEARKYYLMSIDIAEQLSDTLNLIRGLNSLSSVYDKLVDPQTSEEILERAIDLGERIGCIRCLAISYSQLGINYHYQERYHDAIAMYWKEYEMNKRAGSAFDQFFVYQNVSASYYKLNELKKALAYADSAAAIAFTGSSLGYIHDVYKNKHRILKAMGRHKEALEMLEMQLAYKDSIYKTDKSRVIEQLRAEYEDELKVKKISELEHTTQIKELEAARARQWRIYLLLVVALLLISAVVLYSRYQLKKRSEQILDEKNRQLETVNQYKDRLFAIISHDLKSPLSSFSSLSSTLHEYFDQISAEDAKGYLIKLSQSARSLESQMKNLLDWALTQMAERTLNTEPVNVRQQVDELKGFFQLNLDIKKQQLMIDVSEDLWVYSDQEYLRTILRNLLSNAIKFTPAGGSIWVKTTTTNRTVTISVQDSGMGIAREDFEKLFALTADKRSIGNSPEKGTGLGLVLVKEMVDKLGGKIDLESEPDVGTTFRIELPLAEQKKAA